MRISPIYITNCKSDALYHAVARTYSSRRSQTIITYYEEIYAVIDCSLNKILCDKVDYFTGCTYLYSDFDSNISDTDKVGLILWVDGCAVDFGAEIEY